MGEWAREHVWEWWRGIIHYSDPIIIADSLRGHDLMPIYTIYFNVDVVLVNHQEKRAYDQHGTCGACLCLGPYSLVYTVYTRRKLLFFQKAPPDQITIGASQRAASNTTQRTWCAVHARRRSVRSMLNDDWAYVALGHHNKVTQHNVVVYYLHTMKLYNF